MQTTRIESFTTQIQRFKANNVDSMKRCTALDQAKNSLMQQIALLNSYIQTQNVESEKEALKAKDLQQDLYQELEASK